MVTAAVNVLANIVGKSYDQIFKEFEGNVDPDSVQGSGDVKYHLGQSGKFESRNGNVIPVELAANPSHLEAVNPVVEGMARARMDQIDPPGHYPVLPILIHGDAAFAGQGVVAETLTSRRSGYRSGARCISSSPTRGFTTLPTPPVRGVSPTSPACPAPIFHVTWRSRGLRAGAKLRSTTARRSTKTS